jgi:hypothetical protein
MKVDAFRVNDIQGWFPRPFAFIKEATWKRLLRHETKVKNVIK